MALDFKWDDELGWNFNLVRDMSNDSGGYVPIEEYLRRTGRLPSGEAARRAYENWTRTPNATDDWRDPSFSDYRSRAEGMVPVTTQGGEIYYLPVGGWNNIGYEMLRPGDRVNFDDIRGKWDEGVNFLNSTPGYSNVPSMGMSVEDAARAGFLPFDETGAYDPSRYSQHIGWSDPEGSGFGSFLKGAMQTPAGALMTSMVLGPGGFGLSPTAAGAAGGAIRGGLNGGLRGALKGGLTGGALGYGLGQLGTPSLDDALSGYEFIDDAATDFPGIFDPSYQATYPTGLDSALSQYEFTNDPATDFPGVNTQSPAPVEARDPVTGQPLKTDQTTGLPEVFRRADGSLVDAAGKVITAAGVGSQVLGQGGGGGGGQGTSGGILGDIARTLGLTSDQLIKLVSAGLGGLTSWYSGERGKDIAKQMIDQGAWARDALKNFSYADWTNQMNPVLEQIANVRARQWSERSGNPALSNTARISTEQDLAGTLFNAANQRQTLLGNVGYNWSNPNAGFNALSSATQNQITGIGDAGGAVLGTFSGTPASVSNQGLYDTMDKYFRTNFPSFFQQKPGP